MRVRNAAASALEKVASSTRLSRARARCRGAVLRQRLVVGEGLDSASHRDLDHPVRVRHGNLLNIDGKAPLDRLVEVAQ